MENIQERRDRARVALNAITCQNTTNSDDKQMFTQAIRDLLHLGDELDVKPYEALMDGWKEWLKERNAC